MYAAITDAGLGFVFSDKEAKEELTRFACDIVAHNFMDMLMATGGELSNLFAKSEQEVMKGGV